MEIFGLTGIQATVLIAVSGVILHNVVGWLKSTSSFNPRMTAASGILALFSALMLVAPQLEALPNDLSEIMQLQIFVSLIATIAGFDAMVKNGTNAIIKAAKK